MGFGKQGKGAFISREHRRKVQLLRASMVREGLNG